MHILAALAAISSTPPILTEFGLTNTTIWGQVVDPSPHFPIAAYKLTTGGEAQKAEGSTSAPVTYNRVALDFLEGGTFNTGDYEAEFVVDSETGVAATWGGDSRGAGTWHNLGTVRTWTWQKDSTNIGTATANVTVNIREVADTGNSVSAAITFKASVEA